jgi:16S rRNA (guanine966-N2)-methyltransferase
MSENLRITGGSIRNRKLVPPPKDTIRPASDMIRQAVFNMLGNSVEDKVFHDVFAGTGIVGLEALSRGAKRAIFVERDRDMVALIKRNIAVTRFDAVAAVRQADAFSWGAGYRPMTPGNIVFLGPPYPLFWEPKDVAKLDALLAALQANLGDDDLLVYQYPKEAKPESLPDAEHWIRMRKYGKTRISIWKRNGADGDPIWAYDPESDQEEDANGSADDEFAADDAPGPTDAPHA